MGDPVIVEVALNGGTPRARSPQVPITPDEVARDALRCIDAGAAIVHNHTRDPVLGGNGIHGADDYLAAWRPILDSAPDTILYPTMGSGQHGLAIEDRYAHIVALGEAGVLGMGLVDPGSTDIGRFDESGAPRPDESVYQNTWADGVHMVETCRRLRVGLSVSIFEPGFLRFILGYVEAGRLPQGTLIKLYFGGARAGFGLPPTAAGLDAYLDMLDGTGLPWLVSVQGGDVVGCGLARLALERGGHLQVGLEPSADPQRGNVELVAEAAALARSMGREPVSSRAARALLDLPGH